MPDRKNLPKRKPAEFNQRAFFWCSRNKKKKFMIETANERIEKQLDIVNFIK